jgi:hypothetical protein
MPNRLRASLIFSLNKMNGLSAALKTSQVAQNAWCAIFFPHGHKFAQIQELSILGAESPLKRHPPP